MACTIQGKILVLVSAGLLMAILGVTFYVAFPYIMDYAIKKKLVIHEGSETYTYWKDIPVPIYIHFYFFNITNREEIWNLTNKPVLEEVGPYTFRESREKVNIVWNKNGSVTYRQIRRWYYQPDKTNGSLDDIITTLNVPMVAAAAKGKQMNEDLIYYALEEIFDTLNCTWFVQKSARELLFDGYYDKLMDVAKKFMNLPYDKFGWFYKRNGTDDGEINIYTGQNDINQVDQMFTWNGNHSVSAYSPPCNMINGTAGDLWPPGHSKNGSLTLFVTDLCRSMTLNYLSEVTQNDLKTYRYWADNKQLDNGKYDPDNKCFCSENECLPAGGMNVSSCKFDAPAVVSYPHFLFADSVYSQGVIGMRPNPQKHRFFLDIVPEMGIPVNVAARMQINIVLEAIQNLTRFENITERIYFPILWFSETAEAGGSIVSQLKLVLKILPLLSTIFSFIMVSVGSLLVLTAFLLSILYSLGKFKDEPKALSRLPLLEEKKVDSDKSEKE